MKARKSTCLRRKIPRSRNSQWVTQSRSRATLSTLSLVRTQKAPLRKSEDSESSTPWEMSSLRDGQASTSPLCLRRRWWATRTTSSLRREEVC
jgi:hypothetical protein